jgi:hypothetical protein
MQKVYEANYGLKKVDFENEADARKAVEANGSGYVVNFYNNRSGAMNVYENGAWRGVNIHE